SQTINNPTTVHDIAVRNNVLYTASGGFYAHDLTNPGSTPVNAGNPCGSAYSVAVDGTYAFVGADCGSGRIEVYDITHPKVPVLLKLAATNGAGGGVTGTGNQVVVADGQPGVTFFDVATPATPRLIATQPVGGTSWDVKLSGGKLYVANDSGIAVVSGVV